MTATEKTCQHPELLEDMSIHSPEPPEFPDETVKRAHEPPNVRLEGERKMLVNLETELTSVKAHVSRSIRDLLGW